MTDPAVTAEPQTPAQREKALHERHAALRKQLETVKADRDEHERNLAKLDEQLAAASARAYLDGSAHPDTAELDKARLRLRGLEVAEKMVEAEAKRAGHACEGHRQGMARKRFAEIAKQREAELKQAFALLDLGMRYISRWTGPTDPVLRQLPWNAGRHFTPDPTPLRDELLALRGNNHDVVPDINSDQDGFRHVSWYSREKPARDLSDKIIAALNGDTP